MIRLTLLSVLALAQCGDAPKPVAPGSTAALVPPASIDASGEADVTEELNRFLALAPDGSTIRFPEGAKYRVEGVLTLRDRHDLTLDGQGTTVFASTDGRDAAPPPGEGHLWPRSRSHVEIRGGSGVTIRNLIVRGANPKAGSGPGAYVEALEGQHGFDLRGVRGVVLQNVVATDTYGDFVYLGPLGEQWTSDVVIRNSRFERSGRQGIAVTGAENVTVEGSYIGDVGRSIVDIEPLGPGWGAHEVTFRSNTFGYSRHLWVTSGGSGGNVQAIRFESNRLVGMAMKVKVQDSGGEARRGSHAFVDNVSDARYDAPVPAFLFKRIDGVTVIGNVHEQGARERARPSDTLVYACDSTDVAVRDNGALGFSREVILEGECEPR